MSAAAIGIVSAGVVLQVVCGRLVGSAWLAPDLTLLGIALAMLRTRPPSLRPALFGAALAALLSVRSSWIVGLAYLGAGGAIRWVSARWDLSDLVTQLAMIAVIEVGVVVWWLGAVRHASLGVIGLALGRVVLTAGLFPIARWLAWGRWTRGASGG